ncbi:MAG: hypothetical protein KKD17_01820 [Nanoarchaeota archaeon]|nr:hypothetical protein [Nanoarchaeota archaeon]
MVLSIEAIINGKAKQNRGRSVEKELMHLRRTIGILPGSGVQSTATEEEVTAICDKVLMERIMIAFLSGGDGAVHYFMTEYFKQAYRRFGKRKTPIEFARAMNRMALNKRSKLFLPCIYHRPRGTVNVYSDVHRMEGDLEDITANIDAANRIHPEQGTRQFRRVYVPVLMLYDKEHPKDLDHVQLMTLYADGFLYNFFSEYYLPKDRGGSSNMLTALKVVANSSASALLDRVSPRKGIPGTLYSQRYIYRILDEIEGEVTADDRVIIGRKEKRNALAIGTMGVSLYGLRPFHQMPKSPEEFQAYFKAGEPEKEEALDPAAYSFHLLAGNPDPLDIVWRIPNIYRGRPAGIPGIKDTLAKKVEIEQAKVLEFIADGSRHSDGKRVAIEIAYLQPFILLDHAPME